MLVPRVVGRYLEPRKVLVSTLFRGVVAFTCASPLIAPLLLAYHRDSETRPRILRARSLNALSQFLSPPSLSPISHAAASAGVRAHQLEPRAGSGGHPAVSLVEVSQVGSVLRSP